MIKSDTQRDTWPDLFPQMGTLDPEMLEASYQLACQIENDDEPDANNAPARLKLEALLSRQLVTAVNHPSLPEAAVQISYNQGTRDWSYNIPDGNDQIYFPLDAIRLANSLCGAAITMRHRLAMMDILTRESFTDVIDYYPDISQLARENILRPRHPASLLNDESIVGKEFIDAYLPMFRQGKNYTHDWANAKVRVGPAHTFLNRAITNRNQKEMASTLFLRLPIPLSLAANYFDGKRLSEIIELAPDVLAKLSKAVIDSWDKLEFQSAEIVDPKLYDSIAMDSGSTQFMFRFKPIAQVSLHKRFTSFNDGNQPTGTPLEAAFANLARACEVI